MTGVLAVRDLTVAFPVSGGRVTAVRGVSFGVDAGRTLAIVGESGSGKSASLLAATGLLTGTGAVVTGQALHHGTDLIALPDKELRGIRGRRIGFVFQDPLSNLHPLKTIGAQVGEAITAHRRVPRAQVRRRVIELLDEVGIKEPQRRVDDHPVHFSGGMRQRAMIAMAIALGPELLIADEATTALDVTVQAAILRTLARLQRDHAMAMIFVSHDLAVVSDIADDVVVLRGGEVVESAPADRVYTAPAHPYTAQLLTAARHRPPAPDPATPRPDGATLLELTGVHKQFVTGRGRRRRRVDAVGGVSLTVHEHEIVGLVGESGSGKSTIGRIVAGLARPSRGAVSLRGVEYNPPGTGRLRLPRRVRADIQVVFQDPYGSLNPRRRIASILAEPFEINTDADAGRIRAETVELLRHVELPATLLDRYPAQLSGGQRQRVAIARALALHPSLVVADEAVSALDVTTQAQVLALLRRLRDDLGVAFLFISHDLSVVAELCDRVVVLNDGRVVEAGPTAEVFGRAEHPYTRLLLDSIPGARRALVPLAGETGGG